MKLLAVFTMLAAVCQAQEPVLRSWIRTQSANASVQASAPDVHSVRADECFVYITSAGLSLHSFGPLEANQYDPPSGLRALEFRIPKRPQAAAKHPYTPLGIVGVFSTGVPIYNAIGTNSYNDQNLWHEDAVRASAALMTPLLSALLHDQTKPSPIIGYALDGFPIYGPFARNDDGRIRRMRSSYRLRTMSRRDTLPDRTQLTPSQEGPAVNPHFPLGTFAEDYEYAPATGDLDEFNGAFVKTSEYPDGAYAYFLATSEAGELAWPFLIGPLYYGETQTLPPRLNVQHSRGVDFAVDRGHIQAGEPTLLSFLFRDRAGRPIRFLETVHQQPVHLVIVSKDLADFAHIHPAPVSDDALTVTHTFPHAGDYWIYADYTAPGEAPSVARFAVRVIGEARRQTVVPGAGNIEVTLTAPPALTARTDVALAFHLTNKDNGQPVADLEPWLGSWAHIMIVSADGANFIHAHPVESVASGAGSQPHIHAPVASGSSPPVIQTATGFNAPGRYKVWLQFQRQGEVMTRSWVLDVKPGVAAKPRAIQALPPGTIRVSVSAAGFEPARIVLPAGKEAHLAFTRNDAQNCANEVVIPAFGLRRALPVGETVRIDLAAHAAGELRFACGMGMHKGVLLLRAD